MYFSGKNVLTAAHCCNRGLTYVRLGETGDYEVKLKSIKRHPKFDSKKFKYDFCVLTLAEDVTINIHMKPNVQIARIPTGNPRKPIMSDCDKKAFPDEQNMDATGFGFYRGCKTFSKLLNFACTAS